MKQAFAGVSTARKLVAQDGFLVCLGLTFLLSRYSTLTDKDKERRLEEIAGAKKATP